MRYIMREEVSMTRDHGMTVRFSDEEREALDEAARREDLPASIIVRRAVRKELERLQVEIKPKKSTKRPR